MAQSHWDTSESFDSYIVELRILSKKWLRLSVLKCILGSAEICWIFFLHMNLVQLFPSWTGLVHDLTNSLTLATNWKSILNYFTFL